MLFCRYCGEKLYDDSMFCSFCGKKLLTQEQSEFVETTTKSDAGSTSAFKSDPEFVWNLSEFPQPRKTEEIALEWQDALKATSKPASEPSDIPEKIHEPFDIFKKASEPPGISKNLEAQEILHTLETISQLTPEKKITLEEIKQEIEMTEAKLGYGEESELNYGERIDKFYTFNKKNEEFQKLLDKEYERTRNKEKELSSRIEPDEVAEVELTEAKAIIPEATSEAEVIDTAVAMEEVASTQNVNLIFDNDTLSKKFDTKELNSDLITAALERAGIKVASEILLTDELQIDEEQTLSQDTTAALKEMSESVGQSNTYTSDFTPRFVIDAEDELEPFMPDAAQEKSQFAPQESRFTTEEQTPQPVQQAAQAFSAAVKMQNMQITDREPELESEQPEPAPEPQFEQPESAPEPQFEQPSLELAPEPQFEQPESAPEPQFEQPSLESAPEPQFEQPESAPEPQFEQPSLESAPEPQFEQPESAPEPQFEQPQFVQEEPQEIDPEVEKQEAFKKLEQMWDSEPEKKSGNKAFLKSEDEDEAEDENSQKKGKASTIIIAVLAVVLTVQLAVLGIIHAMPESRAATFINNELGFAVTWFDNVFGGREQNSGGGGSSGMPPETDMSVLISYQIHHNMNIHHIEPMTTSGFVPTRQYEEDMITESVPIRDNLWRMENDEKIFFDQEIVATIIKFNTRWIDYVNHSRADIFEVTMPGSLIEQSIRGFDRFGEVNKTFLLLQIGDIRQYGNNFFVWTHEKIESVSASGIETQQQNRIYELEIAGGRLYITRYFED